MTMSTSIAEIQVLIVEDDDALAYALSSSLGVNGYEVTVVPDGESAIRHIGESDVDIVILDLVLGGMTGFDALRTLRRNGVEVPVLIISGRDREIDKVQGLRLGADDYVVKPVGVIELLERVEAILRRARNRAPAAVASPVRATGENDAGGAIDFGWLSIDPRTRVARRDGVPLTLSWLEFELLHYLMRANGAVVTRHEAMRDIWKYVAGVSTRTIDQHIAKLRGKIERDPTQPVHIVTARKAGYRFQA